MTQTCSAALILALALLGLAVVACRPFETAAAASPTASAALPTGGASAPSAATRATDAHPPATRSTTDAARSSTMAPRSSPVAATGAVVRAPDSVTVDRELIAASARWAPGQLDAHFDKHGRAGPYPTVQAYDAAARETIRVGTAFTYIDRESNAERLGFYDREGNRFTAVTRDGTRITTFFRPDRGVRYVRGLDHSTYR
ncbi:MAG: hypothetical protein IT305_04745 [Chloroflexi bacterium]|nr:hypothetical protein [Chloroflexota bacterium]